MNGIPKGLCSFGGVQRQRLWWGDSPQCGEMSQSDRGTGAVSLGQSPAVIKRSARGESKNNLVNCFSRGDALQVRASPYRADNIRPYSVSFIILLLGTGRRGRRPLQIMITRSSIYGQGFGTVPLWQRAVSV